MNEHAVVSPTWAEDGNGNGNGNADDVDDGGGGYDDHVLAVLQVNAFQGDNSNCSNEEGHTHHTFSSTASDKVVLVNGNRMSTWKHSSQN